MGLIGGSAEDDGQRVTKPNGEVDEGIADDHHAGRRRAVTAPLSFISPERLASLNKHASSAGAATVRFCRRQGHPGSPGAGTFYPQLHAARGPSSWRRNRSPVTPACQPRRTVPARQHHQRPRLAHRPVRTSTSACARNPQRQATSSLNTGAAFPCRHARGTRHERMRLTGEADRTCNRRIVVAAFAVDDRDRPRIGLCNGEFT